jgi:hypothetical protein
MKSFSRSQIVLALFIVLACTSFTIAQVASDQVATDSDTNAQDQISQTAPAYTYKEINFPKSTDTYAYAINNSGEVVGYYTGAGCSQSSCGFTYSNGKYTSIECALEDATDFFDISNKGEIVGAYSYDTGVNGFIWQGDSSCFSLADPSSGATQTEAWGVNDSGDVVGFYIDAAGNFQGFGYASSGSYTNIACSDWTNTRAYGINDAGEIVGDNANSSSGPFSGFVAKSETGACTNINYPKATATYARGINKSDQITGFYTGSSGTFGFVKTGKTFHELKYPNSVATLAYHGNDKGQIAGWYENTAGTFHGFVATPKAASPTE